MHFLFSAAKVQTNGVRRGGIIMAKGVNMENRPIFTPLLNYNYPTGESFT